MTPAARIQAVIEILTEVLAVEKPADAVASFYFRNRRFIGSKDRAAIQLRFFRVMREYHRLSWWITQNGGRVDARTLTIADLILHKEFDAKAVNEIFSGAQYAPLEMTKPERDLTRALMGKGLETPEMPERERLECPEWAYPLLKEVLGPNLENELQAMMTPAPLDLRVNAIKASRDELLAEFRRDGLDAEPGKISPLCIRMRNRPPIAQHEFYKNGLVEIQDEGSQMVALLAQAKPGEQVADFCAGAGGKTLALGASMNNKGRIVAMDVLDKRLERAKERFRRAGLHNIETRALTSERDKYVKRHERHFDLVLVDAPCTGVGTWRRDPDKRWRMLGPGISSLVPLQKNIIDSAYRMVKPGGRLVYATCSLLPDENERQVETFLAAHPEFTLKPAKELVDIKGAGDYLKLTPAQHDTDGFFAAVLVRNKSEAAA
ncbi:MAG TPA: RsmB/NOP family class I SAM-dependent RNA methyltransferase [Patescibacteria group bacterium]|nr:RsmB/NOP family class I SAM-dependent RNA methyltransferase [Patescibacteria group bacterium]